MGSPGSAPALTVSLVVAPMPDTREQIAQAIEAALSAHGAAEDARYTEATGEYLYPADYRNVSVLAAGAALPIAVRAVTDRVREVANIQAISCHAAPGEYGPERPWLDLLALLDQIDAELEGE